MSVRGTPPATWGSTKRASPPEQRALAMAAPAAPRAVRVLELGDDGAPVHAGLLVIEVGTRLVFSARPNTRVDLVRAK